MSRAATPYHCPFCGDEDLRPHEVVDADGAVSSPHGTWECRSCLRAFSLSMLGMIQPGTSTPGGSS